MHKQWTVESGGVTDRYTLPEVMGLLCEDSVDTFCRVRTWQRHPLHIFLTMVAALAADQQEWEAEAMPVSPSAWEKALLDLSDGNEDAWTLVVEDPSRVALLQPPCPGAQTWEESGHTNVREWAESMDWVYINNLHHLMPSRQPPSAEDWMMALISQQMIGYYEPSGHDGRSYNSPRVKGSNGVRVMAHIVPSLRWGQRLVSDVRSIQEHGPKPDHERITLGWTEPRTGQEKEPIDPSTLSPLSILPAHRARLSRRDDQVVGLLGPNKARWIDDVIPDPWQPRTPDKDKVQGIWEQKKWRYDVVSSMLLEEDYDLSPCMSPESASGGGWIELYGIAMREHKTLGIGHRREPIPPKVGKMMATEDGWSRMKQVIIDHIEMVDDAMGSVLRPSLMYVLAPPEKLHQSPDASEIRRGGGAQAQNRYKRYRRWMNRAHEYIDERFFPSVWEDILRPEESDWDVELGSIMRRTLNDAMQMEPIDYHRSYMVRNRARQVMERQYDRHLSPMPDDNFTQQEDIA